jgi:hypothetical protein
MVTREDIQKRSDYFGKILESNLSFYSPEQTAKQLGVPVNTVLADCSALLGYLTMSTPEERQAVLRDDLKLAERFRGRI